MSHTEYRRTPFHSRQCLWTHPDGERCRSYAEHNRYFYCQHSNLADPDLRIVPNVAFFLPPLDSRANIQEALNQVACRLAIKILDDRTADYILKTIGFAIKNLRAHAEEAESPHIPLLNTLADAAVIPYKPDAAETGSDATQI